MLKYLLKYACTYLVTDVIVKGPHDLDFRDFATTRHRVLPPLTGDLSCNPVGIGEITGMYACLISLSVSTHQFMTMFSITVNMLTDQEN